MIKGYSLEQASSGDSSDDEMGQSSTQQIMAKLSATFVDDPIPAVETVHTAVEDGETVRTAVEEIEAPNVPAPSEMERVPSSVSTATKSNTKSTFMSMPKFRKVQSMDARIASPSWGSSNKEAPVPTKTFSRVVEEEETETDGAAVAIETTEDPVLVPTPTPSLIAATSSKVC
jgi:hypothetical protein